MTVGISSSSSTGGGWGATVGAGGGGSGSSFASSLLSVSPTEGPDMSTSSSPPFFLRMSMAMPTMMATPTRTQHVRPQQMPIIADGSRNAKGASPEGDAVCRVPSASSANGSGASRYQTMRVRQAGYERSFDEDRALGLAGRGLLYDDPVATAFHGYIRPYCPGSVASSDASNR